MLPLFSPLMLLPIHSSIFPLLTSYIHTYTYLQKLKVQFIGEEGVDEGGVQKEYFQVLFRQMFDKDYGMFKAVEEIPSVGR